MVARSSQTLNAAIGPWVAPADYLRILALRVIAEAECDPGAVRLAAQPGLSAAAPAEQPGGEA